MIFPIVIYGQSLRSSTEPNVDGHFSSSLLCASTWWDNKSKEENFGCYIVISISASLLSVKLMSSFRVRCDPSGKTHCGVSFLNSANVIRLTWSRFTSKYKKLRKRPRSRPLPKLWVQLEVETVHQPQIPVRLQLPVVLHPRVRPGHIQRKRKIGLPRTQKKLNGSSANAKKRKNVIGLNSNESMNAKWVVLEIGPCSPRFLDIRPKYLFDSFKGMFMINHRTPRFSKMCWVRSKEIFLICYFLDPEFGSKSFEGYIDEFVSLCVYFNRRSF